jgi:hypothetical protein
MPSPEVSRGPDNQEWEHSLYLKASRFATEPPARRVYAALQETIASVPCDLSTYRFLLDRISHVAVLGQTPPPDLDQKVSRLLSRGESVTLPAAVVAMLEARRAQAATIGPWVEGHYRPGQRVPLEENEH